MDRDLTVMTFTDYLKPGMVRGIAQEPVESFLGWLSGEGLIMVATASATLAFIAICHTIYNKIIGRAKHGSKVVAVDKREKPSWIDSVNSEVPGNVDFYQCDLTKEDSVKAMIQYVVDKYQRLDCLINNAGWHPPHKPIEQFTLEEMKDLMDINLTSQFLTCKYGVPHIRKTQGNVINMSSMTQRLGQMYAVTYVASKGAITAFTKALAIDEAKYSVRANSISPSNVWTPLWAETRANDDPKEIANLQQIAAEMQLLGRLGTSEDVGLACLFLAADATFITGIDLPVSGGAELDYGYKTRTESDEICRWVSLKKK